MTSIKRSKIAAAMKNGLLPPYNDKYLFANEQDVYDRRIMMIDIINNNYEYNVMEMRNTIEPSTVTEYNKPLTNKYNGKYTTIFNGHSHYAITALSSYYTGDIRFNTVVFKDKADYGRPISYNNAWRNADDKLIDAIMMVGADGEDIRYNLADAIISATNDNRQFNWREYLSNPNMIDIIGPIINPQPIGIRLAAIFDPIVMCYMLRTVIESNVTALFNKIKGGNIKTLRCWDVPMGWGDRLVGYKLLIDTFLSNYGIDDVDYIGLDPNDKLIDGYKGIMDMTNVTGPILSVGSEVARIRPSRYHIIGGSPPFFNYEQYSEDRSQSYMSFPDLDSWYYGYVVPTCNNMFNALHEDGFIYIHAVNMKIANVLDRFIEGMISVGAYYAGILYTNNTPVAIFTKSIP